MQKVVFFLLFVAAAGCYTSVNRRPVLEAGHTISRTERIDAVFPRETVPAVEQAAEDAPRPDTPAAEAETPANLQPEGVEWTHNRRHFKKWREDIREMHRDFDKLIFELEAVGEGGIREKPKRHLPPGPHPPPQQ